MNKDKNQAFEKERIRRIQKNAQNRDLVRAAKHFMRASTIPKYSYNFSWMGRPIIQYPQDIVAMQELIWKVKPDLIIETGVAHGGSLIFSASMLYLLDVCENKRIKKKIKRKVVGIDIDIRARNYAAIRNHPLASKIHLIEGSSIAPKVIAKVHNIAKQHRRILVCLDSNHTHLHVLEELKAYAPLTTVGSYCVVFDTIINDLPKNMFKDRPWGPKNNPKKSVYNYLNQNKKFKIDKTLNAKLLITVAPDGFLRRQA
jgi:cephalosporin hydroxylase